ncbi:MAG: IS66 family transposase [Verrucomicrobiales bacterium]
MRQARAPEIMKGIKERLEALHDTYPSKTPMAKAIHYALNQWEALCGYLQDGRLELDNNLIENSIRPTAVGKKNWSFLGRPEASWRSAAIYSIMVSCRRRGINPPITWRTSFNASPKWSPMS